MNDNDKQIAREAAKKLLAWADGATLEWASGGVDIPHPQFIALHVLAGNTVRIRPPAAPPEPKPSQEFLAKNCIEIVSGPMSWQQARANPAYHRLQAVCLHTDGRGGTGEWICTGVHVGLCGNAGPSKLTYLVRPVAQTAPPSLPPKPSQAPQTLVDMVAKAGYTIEHGPMTWNAACTYGKAHGLEDWACAWADKSRGWCIAESMKHQRPGGYGGDDVAYIIARPAPSLPCPPRQTDEQVAAARLNGKRVRLTGQCEEPNGRPWVWLNQSGSVFAWQFPHNSLVSDDYRRWIAEVVEDEPRPWDLDPKHAGKVVTHKAHGGWGVITGVRDGQFTVAGWGKIAPMYLLRDWTWNGQPCGDVS